MKKAFRIELVISYIVLMIMSLVYISNLGIVHFNSDTACESIYVREEMNEGKYFPANWYNGEEILVFTPHTIMLVLSQFDIPAYNVRVIANIIVVVLTSILLACLVYKIFSSKTVALLSTLIVISNISNDFTIFINCQASYAIILLVSCLWLLAAFGVIDSNEKKASWAKIIAFYVLCAFVAMHGLRYMQLIVLPFVVAIVAVYLIDIYFFGGQKSINFKLKDLLFVSFGFLLFTLIGFIIYKKLCASVIINGAWGGNNASSYLALTPVEELDEKIIIAIESFLVLGGYESGIPLLSLRCIASLIKTALFSIMTIILPIRLAKNYAEMQKSVKVYYVFSWVSFITSLLIMILSNITSGVDSSRYLLISAIFMYSLGCYKLYMDVANYEKMEIVTGTIIILCLLVSMLGSYKSTMELLPATKAYYNEISDYLIENDLSFGYASFWHSHTFSVYTNYETEVAPIQITENKVNPFGLLSTPRAYKPSYHEGKSFLMVSIDEDAVLGQDSYWVVNAVAKEEVAGMYIYTYDHNIAENFN